MGRFAWVTGLGIVVLGLVSAQSGAHGGLSAATRDAREDCGPLVAPADLLCIGQRHVWVRFLAMYATPGWDFTGTITVHLDHVLPYAWHCSFANGWPTGNCTEEGLFPRSGMPFDFKCSAEGIGVWGCSLEHA